MVDFVAAPVLVLALVVLAWAAGVAVLVLALGLVVRAVVRE
jgi:hypothetical protein